MATARRQIGYVSTLITEQIPLMSYGTATGGTSSSITVSGVNYTLLTFTASGTLTVTKAGLFDVLILGGGAGGRSQAGSGGGGGAGGVIQYTTYLESDATITVGAGGAAGAFGGRSSIGATRVGILAQGGGSQDATFDTGFYGASTGGTRGGSGNTPFGHEPFYGNQGGLAASNHAGGGGGAGGNGGNATASVGGTGGAGVDISTFIGGSALFRAAGGGGGGTTAGGAGGSSGVGGAGGTASGTSAAANTASGGGGCPTGTAGSGGSGVVYVRFKV